MTEKQTQSFFFLFITEFFGSYIFEIWEYIYLYIFLKPERTLLSPYFCANSIAWHVFPHATIWLHLHKFKFSRKEEALFPTNIHEDPKSYLNAKFVTNPSLSRSLGPEGKYTIQGRLA